MILTHDRYEDYFARYMAANPRDAMWTEAGWLTLNTNLGSNGSATVLEDWQVYALNNPAGYSWYGKSRQVGFSWMEAMKKTARSALVPQLEFRKYLGVFLSLNQDEAKEKIFYVLNAHATLPDHLREGPLKLVREATDAIEFANGSRIFSYPAKAVRGKAGADITLDEFAHIPKVKSVYEGTTAATIRGGAGNASITIGSTPLTETDLFYEIGTNERQYKSFKGQRNYVRWWDSAAICEDVIAARRAAQAESWLARTDYDSVSERVERFGTKRLNEEFGGLPLESFLQEYECVFGANKNAFIPYNLLVEGQDPEWPQVQHISPEWKGEGNFWDEVWPDVKEALDLSSDAGCWLGYDVARKHDYAALMVVTPRSWEMPERDGEMHDAVRVAVTGRFLFRNVPFHIQEALLNRLLKDNRVNKLRIDATGMGGTVAENLQRGWGENRVEMVVFTNPAKLAMASRAKHLYEQGAVLTGGDREITRQFASIQKTVTASGNMVIGGATEDSHADAFWAFALAAEQVPLVETVSQPQAAFRGEMADEVDEATKELQLRDEFNAWASSGRGARFLQEEQVHTDRD